jgi:hypothetical protein
MQGERALYPPGFYPARNHVMRHFLAPCDLDEIQTSTISAARGTWLSKLLSSCTSATAASGDAPVGGSARAASNARMRIGSSCIQPCSSHSRIAPAYYSTKIAQPRSARFGRARGSRLARKRPAEDRMKRAVLPSELHPGATPFTCCGREAAVFLVHVPS